LPSLLSELLAITESAGWRPFGGRFAPVLAEVRRSGSVQRLSVAVSDGTQRVPSVVMGLQISALDADSFVLRLQSSLRLARDSEILRSAGRRYRQQHGSEGMPSVNALLESGLIQFEPGALWPRYRWQGETTVAEPPLAAPDFASDAYQRSEPGGLVLRYLMPPFTANDIEHRFAGKVGKLQLDDLEAGRYRLCSGYYQGTLWIGNDASVVIDWIARLAAEAAPSPYAEVAALGPDVAHAKALALVLPARLLDVGQIYPDDDVNQVSRRALADLAQYRAALFGLSGDDRNQELHVWATLLRR
jgi:hypothetical protein